MNKPHKKKPGTRYLVAYFTVVATLILIAYSNHFNNAFHFDDTHVVEQNIFIRSLSNIPRIFTDASTGSSLPTNQIYRPMVAASLAFDYWMAGGLNPFWFHLSTFCWYLLQCLLLYFFFLTIANTCKPNAWNPYFSLIATAWYGLHTANAETINYVSARSDSLSTCWLLIAFVCFIYWPKGRKWGIYLIPLIVALLFKQTVIVFPALLFLYVLYFEQHNGLQSIFHGKAGLRAVSQTLKTTLPALMVCLIMYFIYMQMTPSTMDTGGPGLYRYLISQPFVLVHYVQTFFLPLQLSADTDWEPLTSINDVRFFVGAAFVFTMLALAVWAAKKADTRPVSFGILWFFIALLPTSSLVPLAEIMNDHRMFFPFIGLTLAVAYSIYLVILKNKRLFQKYILLRWLLFSGIAIVLSAHAYGVYHRNQVWKNEETLWYDVIKKSPKNGRGLMSYGLTQMAKGHYATAEKYFLDALQYTPYYALLHVNLGILKNAQGHPNDAEIYFKNALRYGPKRTAVHHFYALYLKKNHRYQEAAFHWMQAVQLNPNDLGSRYALMVHYADTENWDKLRAQSEYVLNLDPKDKIARESLAIAQSKTKNMSILLDEMAGNPTPSKYLALSLRYYQAQNYHACITACEHALALKPDYTKAWNNICAAYNQLNEPQHAEIACKKALKINPDYTLAKNNLAWAHQLRASEQS